MTLRFSFHCFGFTFVFEIDLQSRRSHCKQWLRHTNLPERLESISFSSANFLRENNLRVIESNWQALSHLDRRFDVCMQIVRTKRILHTDPFHIYAVSGKYQQPFQILCEFPSIQLPFNWLHFQTKHNSNVWNN